VFNEVVIASESIVRENAVMLPITRAMRVFMHEYEKARIGNYRKDKFFVEHMELMYKADEWRTHLESLLNY